MITSLLSFQLAVIDYISRRLRTNVQFNSIKEIIKPLKNDTSTVLLVIDHKQKIESMKYQESQVNYYGKTGMNLLEMMMIR